MLQKNGASYVTRHDKKCRVPYVAPWGPPDGAKAALWKTLATAFEPYAAALYRMHVPKEEQHVALPDGRIYGDIFSYIGLSIHADRATAQGMPILTGKLQGESNVDAKGFNLGLELHHDENNIGHTVVLVFGAPIKGWHQLWPTTGCEVPCGVWSYSVGDAESLLHGVGAGEGFRVVLVYCVHRAMSCAVDEKGKRVLFREKKQSK